MEARSVIGASYVSWAFTACQTTESIHQFDHLQPWTTPPVDISFNIRYILRIQAHTASVKLQDKSSSL